MNKKPRLRVSLVIPAYNEESHLAECLDAVAAQTVKPFEVIVVDNNSTDATAAVARRYPFVTLLHEERQGPAYARDCGFNAAHGDIIGRTDADSLLAPDWVARVQQLFADDALDAVSGAVTYRAIGLHRAFEVIDTRFRIYLARRGIKAGELFLYGVTMAIRRTAWHAVRGSVCHERRFAEDMDLAAHMSHLNQSVAFEPTLQATILPRQAASSPQVFYKYVMSCPRTYVEHGLTLQKHMYPVACLVMALYMPIHFLYKGYNPTTQRFSLAYMWRSNVRARISPVSETV